MAVAVALAVFDAAGQQLPGGVQPGQIERQFERPREPRRPAQPAVPPAPEQRRPADAGDVRFVLRSIGVQGATVYGEAALREAYADLIGKEVSLDRIYDIAEALTRRYRNDGYILSQVVVPSQVIGDGTVRLQAIEGYVAEIRIAGDPGDARPTIERTLAPIKQSRPLRADVLERSLLLVNDLAGISARATLARSAQPGASDLTVSVAQAKRQFGIGLNNRGSRFLGPWRANADADFFGLAASGDRAGLRLVRTIQDDELTYVTGAYDSPIGASGLKFGLTASAVEAHPTGGAALPPDLETRSSSFAATLGYALVRSRTGNVSARATFSSYNGKTETAGTLLSEDKIRAVRLGLAYDGIDSLRGINLADLEYSQGLHGLDATDRSATGSRADVPAAFRKLAFYAARLQALAPRWSVLGAVNAQYAFTNLLAPEQFAYGGEQFGRAYDAAELLGEHGLAGKLELRFNDRGGWLLRDYMLYAFYDLGQIWRRTPQPGENREQAAEAAGLGWRFNLQGGARGFVEGAVPNRTVAAEGNRHARLFAGVQVNF